MSNTTPEIIVSTPSKDAIDRNYVDQWKNRRMMAWLSLISIFLFTAAGLFFIPESRLAAASNLLSWYYMTTSTIVGLYMGLSTWASITTEKMR